MWIWHSHSFTPTLSDQGDICQDSLSLKKAKLFWNLEGRKPWLKIEVFVTGRGHRNGRILPSPLPGCQRSSSLPLGTFGCVEFTTDCLQAAKGAGKVNTHTEKGPEFICCDRSSTHHHYWKPLLTALGWKSFSWFNWSSVGPYPSHCTLLRLLSLQQHQWSRAVVCSKQLWAWSITPNH